MRLVNTKTLGLEDFSQKTIPEYAILSHTWGDKEVSFQDMSLPSQIFMKGYKKIEKTCRMALFEGHQYVWIDTCCIDKSSSAELTESINSMFQWYRKASVCYVLLEDFQTNGHNVDTISACKWFTRGWTLQEMLAAKSIRFFDKAWTYIGSKVTLIDIISKITRIPPKALSGDRPIANYSVAARMSWASNRETTRVEDIGYCLLGIFDVNMPLLYGEGMKAFRRLQEEIVKHNNDLTIFAWDSKDRNSPKSSSLFASSPTDFAESSAIGAYTDDFLDFSVTNKGLRISGDAPLRAAALFESDRTREFRQYVLLLGWGEEKGEEKGIYLRKAGPKLFYRDPDFALAEFEEEEFARTMMLDANDYYILIDPTLAHFETTVINYRQYAVHIPVDEVFTLKDAVPEDLWDISDRTFLRPKPYAWAGYSMVLAMNFQAIIMKNLVGVVVFCDFRAHYNVPRCKIFMEGDFQRQESSIFKGRNRKESLDWADIEIDAPEILKLENWIDISFGTSTFRVTVTFEEGSEPREPGDNGEFSLKFRVSEEIVATEIDQWEP
jgi:hypothetical protein